MIKIVCQVKLEFSQFMVMGVASSVMNTIGLDD